MSGGEWDYKQWVIEDIADRLEHINPVLAEQLNDLHKLIDRYDHYICGDCGDEAIERAWTEYREKWIDINTEQIETLMLDKCLKLVDSAIKGHTEAR